MSEMERWDRRDVVGGLALFALVVGVPAATIRFTDLDLLEEPTARQRELVDDVSDLVIPRTQTPGARDVAVADFVILGLAHGLLGTRAPGPVTPALSPFRRRDGSFQYLAWLEQTLDRLSNGDFLRHAKPERSRILGVLDSEAMSPGAAWSPWIAIKGLILTGYYTSEAGGSRELRYELVPGHYEPDVSLKPDDRAWSSDWTAVEFG